MSSCDATKYVSALKKTSATEQQLFDGISFTCLPISLSEFNQPTTVNRIAEINLVPRETPFQFYTSFFLVLNANVPNSFKWVLFQNEPQGNVFGYGFQDPNSSLNFALNRDGAKSGQFLGQDFFWILLTQNPLADGQIFDYTMTIYNF